MNGRNKSTRDRIHKATFSYSFLNNCKIKHKIISPLSNRYTVNEELLSILHKIKEGLEELRLTSEEYSDSICDDLINKDRIERVKCNRLEKRRGYHHFH